jgi:hypothetical protein
MPCRRALIPHSVIETYSSFRLIDLNAAPWRNTNCVVSRSSDHGFFHFQATNASE